jgi:glutathione S-transferase
MLEEAGLPKGSLWESCAIMQYLCNKHGLDRFYPTDRVNGHTSTARCSV